VKEEKCVCISERCDRNKMATW